MILRLYRGLPGSGKSTAAGKHPCRTVSADDYFTENKLQFHWSHLADAHSWCRNEVYNTLQSGKDCNVANTFVEHTHIKPYLDLAKQFGAEVIIEDLFDGGCTDEVLALRNIHNVPIGTIRNMRRKYYRGII